MYESFRCSRFFNFVVVNFIISKNLKILKSSHNNRPKICKASTSEDMKMKTCMRFCKVFIKKYEKDISQVKQFCIIKNLCFYLKYLGNFKFGNNVLRVFSDNFLKPFGQKHVLENCLSQTFLFKCSMKKYIVKKYQYISQHGVNQKIQQH